jgi:uncharacterized SAM-binding protein YcdF (DUF218 family)
MIDPIWIKTMAKAILLPPTGFLLVALLGLATIRRHPRTGRALATAAVVALIALSMPIVAGGLVRVLDDSPPLDLAAARSAQAIVIPGGGVRRNAIEYGGDTLGRLTLERVRYGARLAKQTRLPVLVTGGSVMGTTVPEAVLMKEALESEYDVKVRWVEDRSRNTRENAVNSATILQADGVRSIVLVLHSFDVPRARGEFARVGLVVIPAPTAIPGPDFVWPGDFVPGVTGLQASHYACYEIAAGLWYRLSSNPQTSIVHGVGMRPREHGE